MVSVNPYTGHASQQKPLHRESLSRFEAVILLQWLVNRRKILVLFIKVPVYNARKRRRPRNAKRREKDRKQKQEKKRSKQSSPHSPYPASPCPAGLATWLV